ncbi:MAG: hypothetical protein KBB83_05200 [Alphaproteobacteria bacterium]|nr:hypothetical protein [Alphaproteobacteria bacterium]
MNKFNFIALSLFTLPCAVKPASASIALVETKNLMRPTTEAQQIQAMIEFWQPQIKEAELELEKLAGVGMKHVPSLEEFSKTVDHESEEGNYEFLAVYAREHKTVDENSSLDDILWAFKHAHNCHWSLEAQDDRLDQFMQALIYNTATRELACMDKLLITLRKQHESGETSIADLLLNRVRPLEKAAQDTILRLKNKRDMVRQVRASRKYVDFLNSLIADLQKDEESKPSEQRTN